MASTSSGPSVEGRVWPSVQSRVKPSVKGSVESMHTLNICMIGPSVESRVGASVEGRVGPSVEGRVGPSVEGRVDGRFWPSVQSRVKPSVKSSVESMIWPSVESKVGASVAGSIGASVEGSVGTSVQGSVEASIGANIGGSFRASVEGSVESKLGPTVEGIVRPSVEGSVDSRVGPSVQSRIGASIGGSFRVNGEASAGASVEAVVEPSVESRVGASVGPSVEGNVESRVGSSVEGCVNSRVGPSVEGSIGPSVEGSIGPSVEGCVNSRVGPSFEGSIGPSAGIKRKVLSLEDRIKVVEMKQDGKSCRKIAEELGVGKTQIQNIIKEKHLIITEIACGSNPEKKYVKLRKTGNEDLNSTIWEWFCEMRDMKVAITGKLIQQRARWIAAERGMYQFKASNGWLEAFKRRNNIQLALISNDTQNMEENMIEDWLQCLPSICKNYPPKDIFNVDETGLFYRALPRRPLQVKGRTNPGRAKKPEMLSVLFCCSATGEKLSPFVIGKSESPRCFRGQKVLNVYVANKKSMMTSSLFRAWLNDLNDKMKMEQRNILLFLDRSTTHADVELSHVRLQFFPPNTNTRLQPCNAGIIRTVKAAYKTQLLRHLLFFMNGSVNAVELAKNVNLFDAITWLNIAWDSLSPDTIIHCFEKCGFYSAYSAIPYGLSDLKFEIPDEFSLFIDDVSWDDYVTMEDATFASKRHTDIWEEEKEVVRKSPTLEVTETDNDDKERPIHDNVINYRLAGRHLEDLKLFALVHEDHEMLDQITWCQHRLESKWIYYKKSLSQAEITDFFKAKS